MGRLAAVGLLVSLWPAVAMAAESDAVEDPAIKGIPVAPATQDAAQDGQAPDALEPSEIPVAPADPEPSEDPIDRGQAIAEANCSRCHAIGEHDQSADPKAPPFRTLKTQYPVESLAESLAEGIVTGHDDMPAFELTPQQIDALIGYLKTL